MLQAGAWKKSTLWEAIWASFSAWRYTCFSDSMTPLFMWQPWLSSLLASGHHHQIRVSVHYKHMNVSQHLQDLNGCMLMVRPRNAGPGGRLLHFPPLQPLLIYFWFICARLGLNCALLAELHFQEWFIWKNRCLLLLLYSFNSFDFIRIWPRCFCSTAASLINGYKTASLLI